MFQNEELKKRLLGLLWGAGVSAVIAFLAVITDKIKDVGAPELIVLTIILICQQLTKYLNTKYQIGGKILGKIKK